MRNKNVSLNSYTLLRLGTHFWTHRNQYFQLQPQPEMSVFKVAPYSFLKSGKDTFQTKKISTLIFL